MAKFKVQLLQTVSTTYDRFIEVEAESAEAAKQKVDAAIVSGKSIENEDEHIEIEGEYEDWSSTGFGFPLGRNDDADYSAVRVGKIEPIPSKPDSH